MVVNDFKTTSPAPGATAIVTDLEGVRARTLDLIGHLDAEQLERVHSPIMSPLAWDLAHIAAYEDLWLSHRQAGLTLLRGDLAAVYDAFETPRAVRGQVELLDAPGSLQYMREVRERAIDAIQRTGIADGFLVEMVLRHELQHSETMLQTMAIAGLLPERLPDEGPQDGPLGSLGQETAADEWIELEAGEFELGAAETEGFSFDNERPRHRVRLAGFRIARRPVSNGQWRRFASEGGYERRELFSDEGWAWRRQADPVHHSDAGRGGAQQPACHLCFYEAEAIARWQGARLPSEAEWERAARAEGQPLAGRGEVWEWTSSELTGYPGFRAHPYREYSEVFFDSGYRVLRGGSWATHPRVASSTFRNWDLPQRRQIFAGVRLATDL